MILRVLKDKFTSLGRDEDGVAFVVTLAVFFFMYLMCIGVFAAGTAVKDRIHLQNACDAAAYSAAVVQADTLSRIATINRAMSWTYVQMTRRQMDYVTYRWLEEVQRHWRADDTQARIWARTSTAICSNPLHHGLDFNISAITLYGARNITFGVTADRINTADSDFWSRWVGGDASFYANRASMTRQIDADWDTIREMGNAIDDLKSERNYSERIEVAAKTVLMANVPSEMNVGAPFVKVEKMESFTEELPNTAVDEARFLGYAGYTPRTAFGNSGNVWFVQRATSGGTGFRRGYDFGGRVLRADWTWYSNRWDCKKGPYGVDVHIGPFPCTICTHPSHVRCSCLPGPFFRASVFADNARSRHDPYYETRDRDKARPLRITQNYFGADGTISVGVARENENPWSRILGKVTGGLFSAFEPFTGKTVVFSSAKAGYKRLNEPMPSLGGGENSRAYRIDWNGIEDWNLCQSDWDAVLIPVRMARTMAAGGSWGGAERFLSGWVGELGVSDDEMRAGGTANPESVDPYVQGWHELRAGSPSHTQGNAVRAKWQIGRPSGEVDWDNLTDRMFH